MTVVRILLADDDFEDRFIIADAFNEIGYSDTINFVEDGEKVLEYLAHRDKRELPTLIVLDLNMPKLNGTETLRILKKNPSYSHIPVIIFSTSVNNIEKEECFILGAANYVTKPVRYEDCIKIAKNFNELSMAPLKVEA